MSRWVYYPRQYGGVVLSALACACTGLCYDQQVSRCFVPRPAAGRMCCHLWEVFSGQRNAADCDMLVQFPGQGHAKTQPPRLHMHIRAFDTAHCPAP